MPTLTIDGQKITVDKGATILKAAEQAGIFIPHYCYHPALSTAGSCRMCFVEVERMGRLQISCSTAAMDDMIVLTDSEKVRQGQRGVLEFLLINHPLDCPECDKAGECTLQDYSFQYGNAHSRFREDKRVRPPKELGPTVKLYTNRCIMCSRCVRFGQEIDGYDELGIFDRGGNSQIDIYPGKPLQNKMAGNVVDICPVGALVDKDYLHKSRVWNLTRTPTVCPGCSAGCNIHVDALENEIHRLKPRPNPDVNPYWICDDGRYGYKAWRNADRLEMPQRRMDGNLVDANWEDVLNLVNTTFERIADEHGADSIAAVGAATATNEENFLLAELFRGHWKTGRLGRLHRQTDGYEETFPGGFHIDADKNWNARGAADMLVTTDSLDSLIPDILRGRIKALYLLRNDIRDDIPADWLEALGALNFLVVHDVAPSAFSALAHVVLPAAGPFETDGAVTSAAGQVQQIAAALFPPGLALPGWDILSRLLAAATGDQAYDSASAVFNAIAHKRSAYTGLSFYHLGTGGAALDRQPETAESVQ